MPRRQHQAKFVPPVCPAARPIHGVAFVRVMAFHISFSKLPAPQLATY